MTVAHLGLIAAFAAGVVSFLSPCVFPLVPGYLSYIAGTTVRDVQGETGARWRVSVHALFFVVGFALIFALLGAIASSIGATLNAHKLLLERVAGLLLVHFGVSSQGSCACLSCIRSAACTWRRPSRHCCARLWWA